MKNFFQSLFTLDKIILSSSLFIYLYVIWLFKLQFPVFMDFAAEDSLFENIQFFAFFFAFTLGIKIFIDFKNNQDYFLLFCYGLFSIVCLVIALEEISWGQRIFKLQTSTELTKMSTQNEINIHNIRPIQNKIYYIFTIIGFYGCFSFLFLKPLSKLLKKRWLEYLAVKKELFFFFLPVLVYGVTRIKIGNWSEMLRILGKHRARMLSVLQEPVELLMALGFLFIMVLTCLKLMNEKKPKKADLQ